MPRWDHFYAISRRNSHWYFPMGIVLHQFTVITSKTTHFEHFAPPPLFALSLSTSVSTNFFEPTSYLLFVSIFQSTSLPVSSRNDQGYTWVSPFCGYPCSRYISEKSGPSKSLSLYALPTIRFVINTCLIQLYYNVA